MEAFNTQLLRFFDWLLWASLQGTVLIMMIVIIQKILQQRLPVHWHYFLWLLLLIRLAVPWLPESKMSIFNLVPRSVQQGRIIESLSEPKRIHRMVTSLPAGSVEAKEMKVKGVSDSAFYKFIHLSPMIWLLGTMVITGYVFVQNVSLWRIVKRERPITDSEILDLLEDCKMQMGVETILAVVVSDKIKSPALFGFVRPRLLLPQGMLETYGLEELRYVFIHELGHLKQRDIYLGWLMALLQVVHWFNPLIWFAFGRMRADRELACDRLAISTMGPNEPPEYGRTIVSLLESFSQVRYLPSVAGILEDTCQMERRIKMIANYKKTPRPKWAGAILLVAVLVCVFLTNVYVAKAEYTFSIPVNLGPTVNSWDGESSSSLSTSALELYFDTGWPGDLMVTTRQTTQNEWGNRVNLGQVINSTYDEYAPCISVDGLVLYFTSNRPGGFGDDDIWIIERETKNDPWGEPVNMGPKVNSIYCESMPSISADGLSLFFSESDLPSTPLLPGGHGQADIWVTTRPSIDAEWGVPTNLGPIVNTASNETAPCISDDSLTLLFGRGSFEQADIWLTKRKTKEDIWEQPVKLSTPVSSTAWNGHPDISGDGTILYFTSNRLGGFGDMDLWQVTILPVVDFNADGNIDTDDLLILVGYWGQNEPLCDIGPTPYGDGIIDIKDLEVFMSYWEKENMPETPEEEL
jgi:beta-lactamase regulating signal transducer with metallopeptidase domain